jgi:putative ABC transport system permease protein
MQYVFGGVATGNISAPIDLHSAEALGFATLGIIASATGSLVPAINATRIPTSQSLKAGDIDIAPSRSHTKVGILLWLSAIPLLFAPPQFDLPLLGYAAIALILFGAVLCIPAFTHAVLAQLPRHRNVVYQTALAYLRSTSHTATQSVAAILVSVSLMIAIAIMVTSLRGSFAASLERIFPADIQMQTGIASASYFDSTTLQALRTIAGVERISLTRVVPVLLRKDRPPISLIARAIDATNPRASMALEAEAKHSLPHNATPIWISVAFADRFALAPDDTFRIYISGNDVLVSVRGIWRDTQPQPTGRLLMDYEQYRRLTNDNLADAVSVWITRDASLEAVLSKLRDQLGTRAEVGLPGEYRARALRIFDDVFATTYVLLAVAILIGMFGISVNASAQALARRAEFGMLRHLGFTRTQIGAMLGVEGMFLGGLGTLAGLATGTVISAVLIYVVSRQSFHWTMDLQFPFAMLTWLTCAIPIAAAFTSIVSARGVMNQDVIRAVKEDW